MYLILDKSFESDLTPNSDDLQIFLHRQPSPQFFRCSRDPIVEPSSPTEHSSLPQPFLLFSVSVSLSAVASRVPTRYSPVREHQLHSYVPLLFFRFHNSLPCSVILSPNLSSVYHDATDRRTTISFSSFSMHKSSVIMITATCYNPSWHISLVLSSKLVLINIFFIILY